MYFNFVVLFILDFEILFKSVSFFFFFHLVMIKLFNYNKLFFLYRNYNKFLNNEFKLFEENPIFSA